MALIVYKSGRKQFVSEDQGLSLWRALHIIASYPLREKERLEKIEAVYLNYRRAPEAYVRENLQRILPIALSEWVVDHHGKPKKPSTREGWAFATTYGLWENGAPTSLAVGSAAVVAHTRLADRFKVND